MDFRCGKPAQFSSARMALVIRIFSVFAALGMYKFGARGTIHGPGHVIFCKQSTRKNIVIIIALSWFVFN